MKNVNFRITLLIIVIGILGYGGYIHAATMYVSKSGNDGNNGSQSNPWLTIRKCASMAYPGDTCEVGPGTYAEIPRTGHSTKESPMTPYEHGLGASRSNPITFKAATPGTVTVTCDTMPACGSQGRGGVIIQGFICGNSNTSFNWSAVFESANGSTFENNEVIGRYVPTGCGYGNGSALKVATLDDMIVRNNNIHGYGGTPDGGSAQNCNQFQTDQATNVLIEYNTFWDGDHTGAGSGGWMNKGGGSNITFRYNLIHDVGLAGIYYGENSKPNIHDINIYQNIIYRTNVGLQFNTTAANTSNVYIYNNTIDMGSAYSAIGPMWPVTNIYYWNNILLVDTADADSWSFDFYVDVESLVAYCDYNAFYPLARIEERYGSWNCSTLSCWQARGWDVHGLNINPLFVDRINHDYHLQAGSPLRTAGRGGAYATAIGAYLTGTEQIGYLAQAQSSDTTPPAAPTGLSIR